MIEAVANGLMDEVMWFKKHRVVFLGGICLVQFVAAIPMVTGVSSRKVIVSLISVNSNLILSSFY